MSPDTAGRGQHPTPPATAAPWECGRCGERFTDHEEAQRHADTCDRPTMRLEEDRAVTQPAENTAQEVARAALIRARYPLGGYPDPINPDEDGTPYAEMAAEVVAALVSAGFICHDLGPGTMCARCGTVRLR